MDLKLYSIIVFVLCVLGLSGCSNNGNEPTTYQKGSIYGAVTDFVTGQPIANANVSLRPGGEMTLTGSDGIFEFLNVTEGNYSVVVTKAEYVDFIDDYVIKVNGGSQMRRDIPLRKHTSELRVTDVEGHDITELNFEDDQFVTVRSFNIFNNGTERIQCELKQYSNWIINLPLITDIIDPGQNVTINVEIDRDRLSRGHNETLLYITSPSRSNVIKILADRIDSEEAPIVFTLPATDRKGQQSKWNDTFHGKVTFEGYPAYHSRGFCYSAENSVPTINDKCVTVPGKGVGEFSITVDFPLTPATARYYFRAWVRYGTDDKVQYGEVQSFIFNDVL